jgi:hypothetical protein
MLLCLGAVLYMIWTAPTEAEIEQGISHHQRDKWWQW